MPRNSSRTPGSAVPSNRRMPVAVKVAPNGDPSAIRVQAKWKLIQAITTRWQVTEELAGELRPIKTYFAVTVAGDDQFTVFRNIVTGRWYLEETVQ